MAEPTSGDNGNGASARAARIGSARADFISSLGKRVGELRASLTGLEHDPGSPRLRDDLRRRVHALSAGARLLRFSAMATALAEAERLLERAATVGGLEVGEVKAIAEIVEKLPSLAWSEPAQEAKPTEAPPVAVVAAGEPATAVVPPMVLVVGASGLADAITQPLEHVSESDVECERTEGTVSALELARALAPDVAVVDADLAGARELIEKLGRDPLTEPMPLVVVGTWSTAEDGARWVAAGASRALAKPVSPHELRKICLDLSRSGRDDTQNRAPLGEITVERLTELIVEEVKRGLPGAMVQGKSTQVQLGDGSDVLAAVWGAVARVRDLVTMKSGGAVRFASQGPEGAVPIAPWWGDAGGGPTRQDIAEVRLEGRKVVVADDDPAVTWFVGGVLRAAGAEVREAHDGDRALELCFRLSPDLVISDVLMPGLDGFALCRALKRDIALRDVPVILLSWKEDLLQRLRDLGADADGYMRKEASAAALLQRVSEVLRRRARLDARLKGDGEVRGRLDGVTPRTLLSATSRVRADARICVRDASFLYEIEMRGGAPKSATRTTSDGSFQRGREVFAALLGVRAGRFVVSPAQGTARGTLDGDLESQLEAPVAHARAALGLLRGTRLLEVHRVHVAIDRVLPYLAATPEPARSLIHRLADGASPRGLILAGEVAPAQLEDVLCDLATHGAIVGVQGAGGVDLLGPGLNQELASLRRGGAPSGRPPEDVKLVVLDRKNEASLAPESPSMPSPAYPLTTPTHAPSRSAITHAPSGASIPVAAPSIPGPFPLSASLSPSTVSPSASPIVTSVPGPFPVGAPLSPSVPVSMPAPGGGPFAPAVSVAPAKGGSGAATERADTAAKADLPDAPSAPSLAISSVPSVSPVIAITSVAESAPPRAEGAGERAVAERGDTGEKRESWSDDEDGDYAPSSLEAAVIREISDRTPARESMPVVVDAGTAIVDLSELKARVSGAPAASEPPTAIPSLPPDAVVPSSSDDRIKAAEPIAVDSIVPAPGVDEGDLALVKSTSEEVPAARPLSSDPASQAAVIEAPAKPAEVSTKAAKPPEAAPPKAPQQARAPQAEASDPRATPSVPASGGSIAPPVHGSGKGFLIVVVVVVAVAGLLLLALWASGETPLGSAPAPSPRVAEPQGPATGPRAEPEAPRGPVAAAPTGAALAPAATTAEPFAPPSPAGSAMPTSGEICRSHRGP